MAETRKKRPRDPIALAKLIGDIATGQTSDSEDDGKNPAAVALGKLGGAKGGKMRMQKMSKKERQELASRAAQIRWAARVKP